MGLFDFLKKKELQEISELKNQLAKFQPIVDIDEYVKKQKEEIDQLVSKRTSDLELHIESKNSEVHVLESELEKLNEKYKQALEIFAKLSKEISLYESKLDVIEFGIYEPIYDFERSDQYRYEQSYIIDKQKAMIQNDTAAICDTKWSVGESEAKGRALINKYKKLMLRAFNGECDALIAKVKWNNVNQMKERIVNLYLAINKLGEGFSVHIVPDYLELKQTELSLEYEYQLKRQQEKDEQRRIQEELREEEKARREIEQAQRDAEKEETNYQKALEKASVKLSVI